MRRGDGPSGVGGLPGVLADWWDRLPVRGLVAVLVVVGGALVALVHGGREDCESNPLVHVYRPQRLEVVATCQTVTGTVYGYRREHDGDFHVGMRMDDGGWTNLENAVRQHGLTVVEFVPLLPRPARFFVGQRLKLTGTRVLDRQHGGWVEMHPVFSVDDVTPPERTAQPNRPELAPPTEEG